MPLFFRQETRECLNLSPFISFSLVTFVFPHTPRFFAIPLAAPPQQGFLAQTLCEVASALHQLGISFNRSIRDRAQGCLPSAALFLLRKAATLPPKQTVKPKDTWNQTKPIIFINRMQNYLR